MVISIIAILSAIAYIAYNSITKDTRDQRRVNDLKLFQQALEHYRLQNGYYPAAVSSEPQSVVAIAGYFSSETPADPKPGFIYRYEAVPSNCDNSTTTCSSYLLCAAKEGSKITSLSDCTSRTCSGVDAATTTPCSIGLAPL